MGIDKRKFFGTIMGMLMFLGLIATLTYAMYFWKSEDTELAFSISDEYFHCESGIESNINGLAPVIDYRNGSYQRFSVNNIGRADTTFSLTMNITDMDDTLKSESLKYKLVVDTTGGSNNCADVNNNNCLEITGGSGDFSDVSVGMNTVVPTISIPNNSRYQYYFFMYIDGNMENDIEMQNSSMTFVLDVCEVVVFLDYHGGIETLKFLKVTDTYSGLPSAVTKNDTVVTYNTNGGTAVSNATVSYEFGGWYLEDTYVTRVTASTVVSATTNHTLHAKWNTDDSVILPNSTRIGYEFLGWYDEDNNFVGDAGDSYNPDGSETLYAEWEANSYTITLNENGATTAGTGSVIATYDSSTINPSSITLPERKYIVSGFSTASSRNSAAATISSTNSLSSAYIFDGWYTDASNGSQVMSNGSSPAFVAGVSGYTNSSSQWIRTSNTTLYAKWSEQVVMTLPTIVKPGYTCGWTTSSSGTTIEKDSGASYLPSTDTTMYAVCVGNSYTVTADGGTIPTTNSWTVNSGSETATKGVTYNSLYGNLPTPTRTGYTFEGWSLVPDEYQQVDYIQTSGGEYLSTGVTGTARWEFDIQFTNPTTRQLMGYGGTGAEYWGIANASGNAGGGKYGLASWSYINIDAGNRDNIVHNYGENGKYYLDVNGSSISLGVTNVTSKEYGLFNLGSASGDYDVKAKLYRLKAIQGGELVRDFIPCYRKSDGVVGLYDRVNDKFYTNSGSGSFTYGSDIYVTADTSVLVPDNHKIYANWSLNTYTVTYNTNNGTLLPSGYTPVEYVQASGGQYINTGYNPNYYTNVVYDFEYVSGDSNRWIPILGQRVNDTSGMFAFWVNSSSYSMAVNYGTVDSSTISNTNGFGRHIYSNNNNKFYLDGTLVQTISTDNFSSSYPLYIFALNSTDQVAEARNLNGKVYHLRIYDDGILVRNFIPAKNSNGTVGFYDSVNGIFYTNSGTETFGVGSSVVSYNVDSDTFTLPIPSRVGYDFVGWYTSADFSETVVTQVEKGSIGNKTFYAKWEANDYTIAYNCNGGTCSGPTTAIYGSDVNISNPTKTVTVTGNANGTGATIGNAVSKAQTFSGWTSSSSAGLGGDAKIGTSASPITAWTGSSTKNTYFKNLRNGSGKVTLTANWTAVALTLPTVTKNGYLCGWNESATGTTITYSSGGSYTPSATSNADITMYAVCTANIYTMTLNKNGGTSDGTTAIYEKYGTGIYLDSGLTKVMTGSANAITKPVKSYTITYNANGQGATYMGSPTSSSATFNGFYTATSGGTQMITKDGYVNTTNFPNTKYMANATFYAQWLNNSITLPTITKTGYTCKWAEGSTSGTQYTGGTTRTISANTTYYAVCTADIYSSSFVGIGGTGTNFKTLTNMVTNGSFEKGSDSWSLNNASVVSTYAYTGSYSLQFGTIATAMSQQTMTTTAPTLNHKYYGRTMFLSSSGFTLTDNRFEWYNNDNSGGTLVFANKTDQTTSWITKSSVQTQNSSTYLGNIWGIRNFTVGASTVSYVDDVMIIDLTSTYGSGSELTDTSVLDLVPYFDDEEYIYSTSGTYGSTLGTLPTVTKTGYTFKGWYTAVSGGTQITSSTTVPAENKVYYAQWQDTTGPTINVSNTVGSASGSAYNGEWTNQTIYSKITFSDSGSGIDASTLAWKCGDSDWSTISNSSTSTYTDTWGADRNDSCYFRIADNSGNYSTTSAFTVRIDKTKPTVSLSRSDYDTFSWSTTDSLAGIAGYAITNSSTAPSSWTTSGTLTSGTYDVSSAGTYYLWAKDNAGNVSDSVSIDAFTVTRSQGSNSSLTTKYDSSSGIAFASNVVVLSGTSVWASASASTGYTATLTWGGNTQAVSGYTGTITSNVTIASSASANSYTITFNANSGSVSSASKSVTYNSTYGTLPTPTRSGYMFMGWYTEVSSGTQVTASTIVTKASNHTIYAHWEADIVAAPSIDVVYEILGSRSYTASDYSVDGGEGGTWTTSSTDPIIDFEDNVSDITGISGGYVELGSALSTDLRIQIFYATADGSYNETNSSWGTLAAGQTKIIIPFNDGEWTKVRFDLGNTSGQSFVIQSLGVVATPNQWNKDNVILELSTDSNIVDYWQYTYSADASATGTDATTSWVTHSDSSYSTYIPSAYSAERNQLTYVRYCNKSGSCSSVSSTYIKIDKTAPTLSYTLVDYNTIRVEASDNLELVGYSAEWCYVSSESQCVEWSDVQNLNTTSFNVTIDIDDIEGISSKGFLIITVDDNVQRTPELSIPIYKIHKSQGAGTSLDVRFDSTSSTTGSLFASDSDVEYVFGGTKVWFQATATTGYIDPVVTWNDEGKNNSSYETLPDGADIISGYFVLWFLLNEGDFDVTIASSATCSDTTKPTISMSPNSQSTYVKGGKEVTLTLEDSGTGLKANQDIYYAWSTSSSTEPSYSSYVTTTNSEGATSTTVIVPSSASSGLTGVYYLWVKVGTLSDVVGNVNVATTSSAFKFDNTPPTISVTQKGGSSFVTYGTNVIIAGTYSDNDSGVDTDTLYYSYDGSTEYYNDWSIKNETSFSGTWTAVRNTQVWVRIADVAGNYTDWIDAGYVRIMNELRSETYYGNTAGANSKFRVVYQVKEVSKSETQAKLQWRCYVQVTSGNFNGSTLSTNYYGSTFSINSTGTYGDSGWTDYASPYVSYGSTKSDTCTAQYTGASGTVYKSTVSASFTPYL